MQFKVLLKLGRMLDLENPVSPVSLPASPANMKFDQGGGVLHTPLGTLASDDDDDVNVEILSSSTKHPAHTPFAGERCKMQKMDDDPIPVPKTNAARTDANVNQIAEIELCHSDEDMFPES